MRSVPILVVLGLLAMLSVPSAQQRAQDVAFQAAMRTETVTGDLKGAIRQYEQIVMAYGKTDRPVAAKALLRMAECYQKLGGVEARKVYERVVREFPDQRTEAAAARSRLSPPQSAEDSVLWSGEDVPSEVAFSPDGRYLAWCAEVSPNVMVRTVATGDARAVTSTGSWEKSEFCNSMAFSRDSKQLAYTWFTGEENQKLQIRVIQLAASGQAEPQLLAEYPSSGYLELFDWTPDGRVVAQHKRGRTHEIVLIGRDGARQVLKTLGARGAWRLRVSPDGRRIAFDAPANEQAVQHDVFVIGVDGKGETPVGSSSTTGAVERQGCTNGTWRRERSGRCSRRRRFVLPTALPFQACAIRSSPPTADTWPASASGRRLCCGWSHLPIDRCVRSSG